MTGGGEPHLASERACELGLPAIEIWTTLGSTNDRARELAADGARRGTLVVGLEQTAGRGRRGASWASAAGEGVWMSLILGAGDVCPQLPLLIGVACSEALETETGVDVRVKWPNDLVVSDGKLGGILVERGPGWVVAGVGVNVRSVPDLEPDPVGRAPLPPVALSDFVRVTPEAVDLAGTLARHVLDRLDADDAVPSALRAFRARDALRGRWVDTEEYGRGVARGIDEDGMLLLELDDGAVAAVRAGGVRVAPDPGLER